MISLGLNPQNQPENDRTMRYDGETLSYWFLTGESLHGHIGEISFKRENMPHIDLSVVEYLMDDLEAARRRYPISARHAAETEKESG
jgi:hypothetical protein